MPTEKTTIAKTVALALCVMGLADLFWMCHMFGWAAGLKGAAHDPGKFLFHIVILPCAAAILISAFPWLQLHALSKRPTGLCWVLATGLFLFSGATLVALRDVKQGTEVRLPWPDTVGNNDVRSELANAARILRTQLRTPLMTNALGMQLFVLKTNSAGHFVEAADPAATSFISNTNALMSYSNAVINFLPDRTFWRDSSPRAKWAALLTLIGAWYAFFLCWAVAIHIIAWKRPEERQMECLYATLVFSSFWLVLRAYSEWYGNFETIGLLSYPPWGIVLMAIAFASLFVWMLRGRQKPSVVATTVLGVIVAVVGVIGKLKPELLETLAKYFSNWDGEYLAGFYVLSSLAVCGLARAFVGGAFDTQHPPATRDEKPSNQDDTVGP